MNNITITKYKNAASAEMTDSGDTKSIMNANVLNQFYVPQRNMNRKFIGVDFIFLFFFISAGEGLPLRA